MAKTGLSIAAVVLAAGSSERMGKDNKLLLPVRGKPLLLHSLDAFISAAVNEIIVVLGHERERTEPLIEGLSLRSVYNADHLSGQMSSVHCGLSALESEHDGIIIALGDQPELGAAEVNYLIESFHQRGDFEIVIPSYQGQRGNPIIISDQVRIDILAGTRNLGCRKFISNNPELLKMVEMSGPAVITDLDTPQDYREYCNAANAIEPEIKAQQVLI